MSQFEDMTDEELVIYIRTTDKEQFAQIIKRYQNKLLRYAGYLAQDDALAADAVQEAFIKAYQNLNGFNTKKKFSSWIYRIVHNQAINLLKKDAKKINMEPTFTYDSGIDIEDDFIRQELQTEAHDCLAQLPLPYKEVLTLYYLEDKSYKEISDILRMPVNTVGTKISRAKGIMKTICQKNRT